MENWSVALLVIFGALCIWWASKVERKLHTRRLASADISYVEKDGKLYVTHIPLTVTPEEMRQLGWIPADDGSGQWLHEVT